MMSNLDQRIIFFRASDSTWTDYTGELNDATNNLDVTFSMLPGDFIYIGTFLPFNHKFFRMKTAAPSNQLHVKVEVNDLAQWFEVADYMDMTRTFQKTGNLQFTRDQDKTWGRAQNSKRDISAMATSPTQIYNMYWTRISIPNSAPSPTALAFTVSYLGQCFSTDNDLFARYPELRSQTLMTSWQAGKTDWSDQHIIAAEAIIRTLRQRRILVAADQVLDISTLIDAAVAKTAETIYQGIGVKNNEKEIHIAAARYEKAMILDQFQIDANKDGIKSISDRMVTTSRATR